MNASPKEFVSLKDYFILEETSGIKHEYYQGAIFAMTGASKNHNLIVGAAHQRLANQLDDKACWPYLSDFRLKIESVNLYTYPDLSIICGEPHLTDGRNDTFINPTVLIEVLSDSTEASDRGTKTEVYRTISSLKEYLLIAQNRPHVERFQRHGQFWLFTEYSALDDEVALDSIGCTLSLNALYKRVEFDAA